MVHRGRTKQCTEAAQRLDLSSAHSAKKRVSTVGKSLTPPQQVTQPGRKEGGREGEGEREADLIN